MLPVSMRPGTDGHRNAGVTAKASQRMFLVNVRHQWSSSPDAWKSIM